MKGADRRFGKGNPDSRKDQQNYNKLAFAGSDVPNASPKGIRPTFKPSINIIRPMITATSPDIISASDTVL